MPTNETGKLKVAARGDREVVMTREFQAPRKLVFDAWTKPELLSRWLAGPSGWTMTVCTIDLKVGGAYRYEWTHDNGQKMGMGGVYREVIPHERISATEQFDEAWYPGSAVVTTVLTEKNGITTVESTVTYSSQETRDTVLRSPMESGVAASYDRLEKLLETNFA
ncbi:SRPBCC family protein [Edaphobacter albus]|uniref:SRPBCC family protein n=1 Tax=Edaphobacter sp. 4G125 TaxID=2763071 RepID=UPI0016456D4A|nr:SRPBCC family protein [Edaphobacter sp. 4G125]QNI36480.1 SRPBCC family protein [Edaphobacter sp. 4G125]